MPDIKYGKPSDLRALRKPASSGGAPPAKPSPDGRLEYAPGVVMFEQGDQGGDLFFIEDGIVEIFTVKDGETIVLAEMVRGEIIGVMTCLTNDRRMASARAKTQVVCKRVPHESIKKVLQSLPNWMKIVLKEFTNRLTQMNKTYSDSVLLIKRLRANQITAVYTGAQIAAAFASIAEYVAIPCDDYKIVVLEDMLSKLEFVMNMRREEIDRIFAVILEAGLLKLEIEPDKKRTVIRLENAQKLAFFAQFVKDAKHGQTKKFIRARFSNKETRVLSAIVKLAGRLGMDLEKNCKLPVRDVSKSLEKSTGVKFEREALDKAMQLTLLGVEGEGDNEMIVMKPAMLGRTVACIEAVRKLMAYDEQTAQAIAKGGGNDKAA